MDPNQFNSLHAKIREDIFKFIYHSTESSCPKLTILIQDKWGIHLTTDQIQAIWSKMYNNNWGNYTLNY